MLYKKYHRNFVRKFRRGTKVKYYIYFSFYTVVHEPQYSMSNRCIEFLSNNSRDLNWIIVFSSGSISSNIKILC